jgi:hypothetical protein
MSTSPTVFKITASSNSPRAGSPVHENAMAPQCSSSAANEVAIRIALLCAPRLFRVARYNFAAILRPLECERDVIGRCSHMTGPMTPAPGTHPPIPGMTGSHKSQMRHRANTSRERASLSAPHAPHAAKTGPDACDLSSRRLKASTLSRLRAVFIIARSRRCSSRLTANRRQAVEARHAAM